MGILTSTGRNGLASRESTSLKLFVVFPLREASAFNSLYSNEKLADMNIDLPTVLATIAVLGGIVLIFGLLKRLAKLAIAGIIIGLVAFGVFYVIRIFVGV